MTFFYDEIGVIIVFTSLTHQHNIGRFKVGLRYNSCSRGRNMGAKPVARAQRPLDYRLGTKPVPNTHRRRDSTVELSCVASASVVCIEFATELPTENI